MVASLICGFLALLSYFLSSSLSKKAKQADALKDELEVVNKQLDLSKEHQAILEEKQKELNRELTKEEMVDFLRKL